MKSLLTAFATLAMIATSYSATTVGFNSGVFVNPNFTSGGLIVNSNGSQLTNGFYSLAYATTGTLNITSSSTVSQLLSQLTLASAATSIGATGFLNASVTTADPGNTLFGKQIYVLLGNSATLLSSPAAALFTAGTLFPLQDGAGNAVSPTIAVRNNAGLVFGTTVAATGVAAPFTGANGVVQVGISGVNNLVPEPSAALLGALGALGLLRRRRN